jgi:cobalamin biosynthesis Co2+ chelatase CbiK
MALETQVFQLGLLLVPFGAKAGTTSKRTIDASEKDVNKQPIPRVMETLTSLFIRASLRNQNNSASPAAVCVREELPTS